MGGKFRNYDVVQFTVDSIEEPDPPFFDRAGNREPRVHFVERPAFLVMKRRNEIRHGETIMVIADPSIQPKNTCRAFTILCRYAAGLNIHSAQCIRTDSGQ